jgi:membrane protein YdbS with pleckstrin-like domain
LNAATPDNSEWEEVQIDAPSDLPLAWSPVVADGLGQPPVPTEEPAILFPPADYVGLDPQQVTLERVQTAILAIVLIVGGGVAAVITGFYYQFSGLWLLAVTGGAGLLVGLLVFLFAWPPIRIRHVRWKLDGVGLEIQRGVLWRHVISVPLARLQHADISQGPLQRQWGLATLVVYTAGTQHASVELDGLAFSTAVALRDELLRQQGAADVV